MIDWLLRMDVDIAIGATIVIILIVVIFVWTILKKPNDR